MDGPSVEMDGYLNVFGSKQYGREWDDGRFGLAGQEERGMNPGRPMIDRQ